VSETTVAVEASGRQRRAELRAALRRIRANVPLPAVIVGLAVAAGALAPWLAPHDPITANLVDRNIPPFFVDGGGTEYPLGTDRQGRDVLSRVIWGARTSLAVAAVAVPAAAAIGTLLGLLAGFHGGWVESVAMRTVDAMLAFPPILVALVAAVTLGPGFWIVVGVLVLFLWPQYARLVRGDVLALKQRDFVALARIAGASSWRIIGTHLFPNIINGVVVLATLHVGWAIVVEAALSFLGAGIPPPTPTWGGMVTDGRAYIDSSWWISVFPGLAILVVVLSFNLLGDWLRDKLDPRLRQL